MTNPQKSHVYIGLVLVTVLWNIKTLLPFTYGPWPTLYLLYIFIRYRLWLSKGLTAYIVVAFTLQISLAVILMDIQNIEAAIATITLVVFLNINKVYELRKLIFTLKVIFFIYLIVGFLDYNENIYNITEGIVNNGNKPGIFRGGSSLATEPSYFSLIMGCIFVIIASLEEKRYNTITIVYYTFGILLSKSLMGILFLPFLFVFSKNKYLLIIILFSILSIFFAVSPDFFNGRILNVLSMIRSNGVFWLMTDASAQARAIYILKDLYLSYETFFMPVGLGSYMLIQEFHGVPSFLETQMLIKYPLEMPGSFLGYYIVELGLIVCMTLGLYLCVYLYIKKGLVYVLVFCQLLLISTQMISFTFYLLPAAFAAVFYSKKSD